MSIHFADRYTELSRALQTPLCVGLDPHLELIPAEFGVDREHPGSEQTAGGVLAFLSEAVDECAGRVAIVKPQIAFFERLGWRGLRVLDQITRRAHERGLLVLLDAKRGDIGSTAAAYAQAYLRPESPCRVDAITLNPYLGLDSLAPFLAASKQFGVGLFVLAKTSNAGASDFQDLRIDGQTLFERVGLALQTSAATLVGTTGWSNLGVVAGATFPAASVRLREILPSSLFLIPGFGAQGGLPASAGASLIRKNGGLEGGIVSSSRGVLFGEPAARWRDGFRARLDLAKTQLAIECAA